MGSKAGANLDFADVGLRDCDEVDCIMKDFRLHIECCSLFVRGSIVSTVSLLLLALFHDY